MSPEIEKYYETLFDLFIHPGWKFFIEELSEVRAKLFNTIIASQDPNTCFSAKTEYEVYSKILNYETVIRAGYEANKDADI